MTLEEALHAFPGEPLFQCDRCKHTAAGQGRAAIGTHRGCGGMLRSVEHFAACTGTDGVRRVIALTKEEFEALKAAGATDLADN